MIPSTGTTMHVIYREPRDFPGVPFVVRIWHIVTGRETPDAIAIPAPTLEAARALVLERAPAATNIGRMPGDDRAIEEVWV